MLQKKTGWDMAKEMTQKTGKIGKILPRSFFRKPTLQLAQDLLGVLLVHESQEGLSAGRIVETEAYLSDDPACHGHRGETKRTRVMFGPPGHAYLYFIYGRYWCFNVSGGPVGTGEGVLIRALEPIHGIDLMKKRRGPHISERELCRGPGRLVMALGFDQKMLGHDLTRPPLYLVRDGRPGKHAVVKTTRVGLSKAAHFPYRFYLQGSRFISKK